MRFNIEEITAKAKESFKKRPVVWIIALSIPFVAFFALRGRGQDQAADDRVAISGYPVMPEIPHRIGGGRPPNDVFVPGYDMGLFALEQQLLLREEFERRFADIETQRQQALTEETVITMNKRPQTTPAPQNVHVPVPAPAPVMVFAESPYIPAVIHTGQVISPAVELTQPVPTNIARDWEIARQIEVNLRAQEAAQRQDPIIGAQVRTLEADIARVEAARHNPATIAYMERRHGGVDAYLSSQQARLDALRR